MCITKLSNSQNFRLRRSLVRWNIVSNQLNDSILTTNFNQLNDSNLSAGSSYNVDLNNEDYMFALDVGSNDNIGDFNNIKERRRALIMSLDSQGQVIREYNHEIYPEGIQYDWDWDSDSNRELFNSMRIKSINYEKYVGFALTGMLINRIVSFIDVMILEKETNIRISSIVIPKGYDGLELQLYIKF